MDYRDTVSIGDTIKASYKCMTVNGTVTKVLKNTVIISRTDIWAKGDILSITRRRIHEVIK